MSKSFQVGFVTGSRADFGLLSPLIRSMKSTSDLRVRLIVTGSHLVAKLGLTRNEIIHDGIEIEHEVDLDLAKDFSSDSKLSVVKSLAMATKGIGEALQLMKPDVLFLLGDRYEILGAASAALLLGIPIAHLYGGELTEGAYDDAIRHSITKMATLHFVSTEPYRTRIIQMGETPQRVFNVGALGLELLRNTKLLTKSELCEKLNLRFGPRNILVTFHPETLSGRDLNDDMNHLFLALDAFPDAHIFFTKSNADAGGRLIDDLIDTYANKNPQRIYAFSSLGHLRYLSLVKQVDVVVGNSSSGVIEVPSLGIPTVNIGNRQLGRIKSQSVIDCDPSFHEIKKALEKALSHDFREFSNKTPNPYGEGEVSTEIIKILRQNLADLAKPKRFYDLKSSH